MTTGAPEEHRTQATGLEQAFREQALHNDIRETRVVLAIGTAAIVGFAATDVIVTDSIGITHAGRAVVAAVLLWAAWQIRRPRDPRSLDRAVSIGLWAFISHNILISLMRPPDFTQGVILNVLTVMAIYMAVPVRLRIQIPPAVALSIVDSVIWIVYRESRWEPFGTISVLAGFVLANVLGYYVSYKIERSRRLAFSHLLTERHTRHQLQTTLQELKTLRGMIPICCMCKRIRDDKGYFEALEDYLRKNSEADFTHTLCPECLEKYYPDFSGDVMADQQTKGRES